MFGVTYICGIDGYSGKIVGYIIIPVKNNIFVVCPLTSTWLLMWG